MDFRLIYFLLLQNLFDDITFDRQCEKGYPFDKENIRTHEKQRRKIMYSDKEFRTVVFGGYNKEDVHEYLQTIEKDSEVAKFGYQNEIKELKTELEENKNGQDSADVYRQAEQAELQGDVRGRLLPDLGQDGRRARGRVHRGGRSALHA